MPSIAARPAHLSELLIQLRNISVPTLTPGSAQALARADNVELRDLQSLAEHEPGLSLQILRHANARSQLDQNPRGLQQGIHLLGSAQVQRLLRTTCAAPLDLSAPGHRLSLQAMATSRLAWLYLAHWLRSALASDEDARLSLLTLLGVARWKFPLVQPAIASRIEERVQAGEHRRQVERALIGADLDTVNLWHLQDLGFQGLDELHRQLWLPTRALAQAARLAWTHERAPELPTDLKRALRSRLVGSSLAYALALETQVDWYGLRARSLLRAASTWLGRPLDETLRGVQRQALFASGESVYTKGLRAPAVGLLWPPRPARRLRQRTAATSTLDCTAPGAGRVPIMHASPPDNAPSSAAHSETLSNYLLRCDAGHSDLRSLMIDSVRLFADLGLARCALFLRQVGSERLACYFSHGFNPGEASRDLSVEVGERSFAKLLLAQPGSAFRIAPAQLSGLGNKLPPELATWPPPSGLLLATVPVNGRAAGFWWADAGPQGADTDSESFSRFRRAAAAFGPAFTRLLNARSPQQSGGPKA